MGKERVGAGALAVLLTVIGPTMVEANETTVSPLASPDPIIEKGDMPSQKEIDLTEQKEIEIVNQRFGEFLAGGGEYSDEKLEKKLFRGNYALDLGFLNTDSQTAFVYFQAVMLFHENIDGDEILALGIKNRAGERKVATINWPVRKLMKINSAVGVGKTTSDSNWGQIEKYYNEEDVGFFLDQKIGVVLNMTMDSNPKDDRSRYNDQEKDTTYLSLFSNKTDANRQFFLAIWRPEEKKMSEEGKKLFKSFKNQGELLGINSYQDFLNNSNDNDKLPFVLIFSYQK